MSESSWLCEGPPSTVILKENRRQKTESVEGVLLKNHVGVLRPNTPKLEDHCLFLFGKSFEVDTQTLVVSTPSSSHNECAFAFVLSACFTSHLPQCDIESVS